MAENEPINQKPLLSVSEQLEITEKQLAEELLNLVKNGVELQGPDDAKFHELVAKGVITKSSDMEFVMAEKAEHEADAAKAKNDALAAEEEAKEKKEEEAEAFQEFVEEIVEASEPNEASTPVFKNSAKLKHKLAAFSDSDWDKNENGKKHVIAKAPLQKGAVIQGKDADMDAPDIAPTPETPPTTVVSSAPPSPTQTAALSVDPKTAIASENNIVPAAAPLEKGNLREAAAKGVADYMGAFAEVAFTDKARNTISHFTGGMDSAAVEKNASDIVQQAVKATLQNEDPLMAALKGANFTGSSLITGGIHLGETGAFLAQNDVRPSAVSAGPAATGVQSV